MSLDIQTALENIYISPLEQCNLHCRLCYTPKTKSQLSNQQILSFLDRYQTKVNLKSVLFCGGEVFLLASFPQLVNKLLQQGIFVTLITNGTIDRLTEIQDPSNCQLLVSLDGPREIHDQNRGKGHFDQSLAFLRHALSLGFPTEVMFLITQNSYPYRDSFPREINSLVNHHLNFNYITQKANFFNPQLKESGLTPKQIEEIKKNYPSIPSRNFGCFQLSLQSNGLIYGCCESSIPLAKMTDPVETILQNFREALAPCQKCGRCHGCCWPDFLCGYPPELGVKNCREVVKLLS